MDFDRADQIRRDGGFLTIEDTINLIESGNQIFDPFSTLIAPNVQIGTGNVFSPGTILRTADGNTISVGDRNTFHSGCLLEATYGDIWIGDDNQFGDGGFTAKANRPNASIRIGNGGRYLNNPAVFGETSLGSGTQIIGSIHVESCQLDSGCRHTGTDPDTRGGLLKGSGSARNLHVPRGHVISAQGDFSDTPLLPQSHFHPQR